MLILNVVEACAENGIENPWQLHKRSRLAYESCRRLWGVGMPATPYLVDLRMLSRIGRLLGIPAMELLKEVPDKPAKKRKLRS